MINEILDRVIDIVEEHGDSVIDTFGISLDESGNYQFTQDSETQRLRFVADIYGYSSIDSLSDEQKEQSAADLIHYLCTDDTYGYGLDETALDPEYILKSVNMRYAMRLNSYQQYNAATIASDVSEETAAAIMENKDTLSGVDIENDYIRVYTDSEYFSSLIGYTGEISLEEYDALDEEEKENYSRQDIVGKSGIEKAFDDVLRGTKGETVFYVDSLGNVTETISTAEPTAGHDIYLTIDSEIQKYTYQLAEEKLAGIILMKMENVLDYDASEAEDTSDIVIPVGDAYYALIGNYVIDYTEFGESDAGEAEQEVSSIFTSRRAEIISEIMAELEDSSAASFSGLSGEMQIYMEYVCDTVLQEDTGVIDSEAVDKEDETYAAWQDGSVSAYTYLNYAVSKNWIDTSRLNLSESSYSDSGEVYSALLAYLEEYLNSDSGFDKLVYERLIRTGEITGAQLCAIVYEQGVLPMDEELYSGLRSGSVSAYSWLCSRIENLEITPGQLALEPCSAGVVVTDPDTGGVLACVSYPGYDANRLVNSSAWEKHPVWRSQNLSRRYRMNMLFSLPSDRGRTIIR